VTAKEFRNLRKSLSLSQDALAEKLGVSPRIIRYWEAGEYPPARAAALALEYMAREATP